MSNVVNVDAMDKMLFSDASKNNRLVRDIFEDHQEGEDWADDDPRWDDGKELDSIDSSDPFYSLLEDGFGSFYKWAPKVKKEVPAASKLNKKVVEQMMGLSEYDRLRAFTRGDEHNSAAALDVVKNVFEQLPEEVKQQQKKVEKTQQELNEMLDADPTDGDEEGMQNQIEKLQKKLDKRDQKMEKMLDKHEDQIRQTVRAEIEEATEQAEAQEGAESALGWGSERGVLPQVPPEERVKIAEMLKQNPNLKRLIEMAGRMIRIAEKKQKQKSIYAREEISGIELGNYLPDVVMDEFLLLMDPEFESLFYKKYFESELHQYELTGKEKLGKGDLVVLVDCSLSMRGLPDQWSKALALAIYSIAHRQKRGFTWALFNESVVDEMRIPAGKRSLDGIFKMLSQGCNGGTSFEAPLSFTLGMGGEYDHLVGEDEAIDLSKADIIFITDGIADISDQFGKHFLERKEEEGFHLYSIALTHGSTAVLEKFSDKVIKISDLLAEEGKVFDLTFSV